MMTLMEKKILSFLNNMYSFSNTDLETFSFGSRDLSKSWSICSWNRCGLHREVSFGEKPYSTWSRPSLLVLIMVLNTWDKCVLRVTRAEILFVCWFSHQVSTNWFSGEENFRKDFLAKHFYFQVVSMDVWSVWGCLLTSCFIVVQGF